MEVKKRKARNSELEDELENALGQMEENMDESEQLCEIVEPHGSQYANESMGPGVIFISVIELMLSLQDEKQNPKTFESIFRSGKLTQTIYIPSSSRLWPTLRKNGIGGMWSSSRFRRTRMAVLLEDLFAALK